MAIEILEALVVHEAMVLGRMRYASASGKGFGDQAVDLFPTLAIQADDNLVSFFRMHDRLVDERLEEGFRRQHDINGAFDDGDEGRVFVAELWLGIET